MGKLVKLRPYRVFSSTHRLKQPNASSRPLLSAYVSSKSSLARQTPSNPVFSEKNGYLRSSIERSFVLRVVQVDEDEESYQAFSEKNGALPSSMDENSVLRVVQVDEDKEGYVIYDNNENYVEWIQDGKRALSISEKNNNLPILHDEYGNDLVSEVIGPIEKMKIIDAGDLLPILGKLRRKSPKKYRQALETLHQQCIEFLTTHDRNAMVNRLVVVDENPKEGPSRGWALRAAADLKCLQFLGFYSGRFHPNQESLRLAKKQEGSRIISSYVLALEREGDHQNEFTVNPYRTGNVLGLMNTAQYIHAPSWMDETGQLVQNNVGMFRFGMEDKNVCLIGLFIMPKEGVLKGKELLFSYGPEFNPHEDYEKSLKKDPPVFIKEEPEERVVRKHLKRKKL